MNKTTIEWCDYTWNPVTGCKHGCPYCYARKIAERFRGSKAWPQGFKPTCREDRWGEPYTIKKPQTIFVCSMADLFGDWVPDSWIYPVFRSCDDAPQHTYIFLTKNPARYFKLGGNILQKDNFWFGTSETGEYIRNPNMEIIKRLPAKNTFISFEPLLADPGPLDLTGINQVIIGAQTNPLIEPGELSIKRVVDAARMAGAAVFFKNSLMENLPALPEYYPRELHWSVRK